jgi:tetratricopeptide (TPR) repeat protein
MEALMKQAVDGLSAEEKKIMDNMGVKMPSGNDVSKMSSKDLADALDNENRIVPKRDEIRIASIPKGVTNARLKQYVEAIHKKVVSYLDSDIANTGEAIYAYLEKEELDREYRGNAAMGLWATGNPQLALFILGKVCSDTPTANNLNNYASMLTMLGGEHLAIPILENLVNKIPDNIILLNNLGQAWFGLGDIAKAEKYFNNSVAIYPYHPQANLTIAEIAASRGETNKAIEAIKKSIQHAYTKEKEDMLRKSGYKLKIKDIRIPFKPGADPLLLDRYKRPDYPKTVAESKMLKMQWDNFSDDCEMELKKLREELQETTARYSSYIEKQSKGNIQVNNSGNGFAGFMQLPLFATKATLQLNERKTFFEEQLKGLMKKFQSCSEDLEKIKKERKKCVPEAPCTCHRDAESEFLKTYNERKQPYDEEALKYYKQFYGEMVYWSQYTSSDDTQFEIIKLEFLVDFLGKLSSSEYKPMFAVYDYEDCKEEIDVKPFTLSEWDFSKNCKYTAEIRYPLIKQEINCSHTTTTFDAGFLKNIPVFGLGVKKTWVEVGTEFQRSTLILTPKLGINTELAPLPISAGITAEGTITINTNKAGETDWNAVAKAGVELGVGKSIGPVKAKATLGESLELEFDNTGLKDVNLVTEAKIKAEIDLPKADKNNPDNKDFNSDVDVANKGAKLAEMNVKIGYEDRISLMSGHGTKKGTGVLKNVKFASW